MHGDARWTTPQRPPSLRRQSPRNPSLPAGAAVLLLAAVVLATLIALALASAARGDTSHLRARVGESFYLPVMLLSNERISGLDARVTVTPPGILRPLYASGPRRCLSALGARGVALVCEPARRIAGPPLSLVYGAVAAGVATVTLSECRVGEAMVPCPLPIVVEVRR